MKTLKKLLIIASLMLIYCSLHAQNKVSTLNYINQKISFSETERITAQKLRDALLRVISFSDSLAIDVSKAKRVATYADLNALPAPVKSTVYRVTNDEKRNYKNTLYIWWDDGKRQWFPAIDDN